MFVLEFCGVTHRSYWTQGSSLTYCMLCLCIGLPTTWHVYFLTSGFQSLRSWWVSNLGHSAYQKCHPLPPPLRALERDRHTILRWVKSASFQGGFIALDTHPWGVNTNWYTRHISSSHTNKYSHAFKGHLYILYALCSPMNFYIYSKSPPKYYFLKMAFSADWGKNRIPYCNPFTSS